MLLRNHIVLKSSLAETSDIGTQEQDILQDSFAEPRDRVEEVQVVQPQMQPQNQMEEHRAEHDTVYVLPKIHVVY